LKTVFHLNAAALFVATCALAFASDASADAPADAPAADARPILVATIPPVAMILRPLVGEDVEIVTLLPPGASPHTYAIRPADARACERAALLVMVDANLDGWAARLASVDRRVVLMDLLPTSRTLHYTDLHHAHADHDHNATEPDADGVRDPHFWTDPLAVRAIVDPLFGRLAQIESLGSTDRERPLAFKNDLQTIHDELTRTLSPARGRAAGMFHPSFDYLFRRYGLVCAGLIEPIPGKTPTPREVLDLTRRLRAAGARAIFTEPQLPRRPAEVLAETSGLKLYELDPLGGVHGRDDLLSFYRHNARILAEGLQ
jgi:ABC-type Zn uptake system ZnuABC Zn-binding protein ZnuA